MLPSNVVQIDPVARDLDRRVREAERIFVKARRDATARGHLAEAHVRRLTYARERRRFDVMLEGARRLAGILPRDPVVRVLLADACACVSDVPGALAAAVAACRRGLVAPDSPHGDAVLHLARTLISAGVFSTAQKVLDAWLRVAPDDGQAWALRADTHEGDEFWEMLVERDLANALEHLPDEPRLLARRAEILARWWSKTLVALRDAERAARLAPDDPVVLRARASAYVSQERYDEALADLERAIALDPADLTTHDRFAALLMHLDRDDDAVAALERAVAILPDDVERIDLLAARLGYLDRGKRALAVVDAALARLTGDSILLRRRAYVLRDLGRRAAEIDAWGAAIAADPHDAELRYRRAEARERRRDLRGALTDWNAAVRTSPHDFELRLGRAEFLQRIGRHAAQALADLHRAVKLAPDHEECWTARGALYLALHRAGVRGARRRAQADFDRACHIWPASAAFAGRAAAREQGRGRSYAESLKDLDRAVKADGNDPRWWWQRALLHEAYGKKRLYLRDLEQANRLGHPQARARLCALRRRSRS